MGKTWHSIREYEALTAMLEFGSTTAAARSLGISQSVVSRALSSLEARIGASLFNRNEGRLRPTAEALALNSQLKTLFNTLDAIESGQEIQATNERLRIAAPPTIAHRFLQRSLANFLKAQPQVTVSLEVCASDALLRGVAEEYFDIGVSDHVTRHSGIHSSAFCRSEVVCALHPTSPLASEEFVEPAMLDGQDLVALTRRHSLRAQTDKALKRASVSPKVAVETATTVSAVELVRAGVGVSIINPFPVALSGLDGVVLKPFRPAFEFQTALITTASKPRNRTINAFMNHVKLSIPGNPWITKL